MQNTSLTNKILNQFVLESLHSHSIPVRKPRNGNMILEVKKNDGLIKKIVLKESYIVNVLGIKKKRLMESLDDANFRRMVLREHQLVEGWFSSGLDFLKDKGVKGVNALKDKAMSVPKAIQKFGSDIKGVTAALVTMINDPEEVKKYASNVLQSVKGGISFIRKHIRNIANWFKTRGLEKISGGFDTVLDFLKNLVAKIAGLSGWKGVFSLMALGACIVYLNNEFNLLGKVKKFATTLYEVTHEPKKFAMQFLKSAGLDNAKGVVGPEDEDEKPEGLDAVQDWLEGNMSDAAKSLMSKSEFTKGITSWVSEKLGFISEIKKKITETVAKAAGAALAGLSGPAAWIANLVKLFGTTAFVADILAKMLQNEPILKETSGEE